ncbi:sugar transferase [Paenilisteria weihenstephanensis]|uniref:sugar transferase n=1 Tax=Listeria weihenstephanensis TaxID=1006155 RepID=UPI002D7ECDCE|nr:sugar transferase [Listeria weihenstephanensis]
MKRICDCIFSVMLLFIFALPMGIIALILKFVVGDRVIFRQKRVGLGNHIFEIYKFQTMRDLYDDDGCLLPDEERLSKMGVWLRKTSLDELPQLVNILKGQMSFIGPRPLLVSYLERYTNYQKQRHNVLPGLSGYAQVNGRNAISWEKKFEFDIYYVKHLSFYLDFKILLLTFRKVIFSENISKEGHATTSEFINREG